MISFLKNVTSPHVLRTMYFASFHAYLRYGLTLWGGDPENKRIFRLQKKVLRIIGGTGRRTSHRNLFKTLNILPLPCMYISETVCGIKSNMEKKKYNREIHDYCRRQKSDFHTQFCRTTLLKRDRGSTVVKVLCYKSEGRWFDPSCCQWIFH